ncbi:MBL fold metallo-hydrolase [Vibrio sp. ABG19]|uniref:MBL fold metallo-hydrolase RNA specificity domain-containing protein n=1 Tax=Vibrio sp. ABG19 TaxID=2817385 RepID=UPI00249D9422|nr:MBL fold metallo-hydrolase [Vibrio sp. ABG19]WGY48443.1 MBL fold metallo-hydrolase [Vibrio sp. ABG19]
MQLIHHGGKHTVTGSCHELRVDDLAVLIDCGMFQGQDVQDAEAEFDIEPIQALLLTHAHIDHIGRLPWLIALGFSAPIYCTPATAELIPLMLQDGMKLQSDLSAKQREVVLDKIDHLLEPVEYETLFRIESPLGHMLQCQFVPAGHILGSAYVEIQLPNQEVIIFSGDLGPSNTPLLPDPVAPMHADYLVLETTYGGSQHDGVEVRAQKLNEIISRSLADGGTILIPAFSVGRTQELLFDIEQLVYQHQIKADLPIILDSPMAQKVTESYRRFKQLWGEEAKQRLEMHRHPLAFDQCVLIEDHRSHLALVNRLASTGEASIVVAASGMCEGGRIVDYLKALLPDERTDVIFAGFQAQGTLGRALMQGDKTVTIDDEEIVVNAQIHVMSGYSAHADQEDLLNFVHGLDDKPKAVHLIHGEQSAREAFAALLRSEGYNVVD